MHLHQYLEREADFNEAREKHFRDKKHKDDELVWKDEYYQNFNKKKEMEITDADKEEAMNTKFIMT